MDVNRCLLTTTASALQKQPETPFSKMLDGLCTVKPPNLCDQSTVTDAERFVKRREESGLSIDEERTVLVRALLQ